MAIALYFLPIKTPRATQVRPRGHDRGALARVKMTVEDRQGEARVGLGRDAAFGPVGLAEPARATRNGTRPCRQLSLEIAAAWLRFRPSRAIPWKSAIGFRGRCCPSLTGDFNRSQSRQSARAESAWLAALVCTSAFDLALHDALRRAPRRADL